MTTTDHDIFVLRRISGSWSISTVANIAGSDDRFPSITSEYQYSTDYQYILYEHVTSYDNRDLVFAKSTDNGATWTPTTLYGSSTTDVYSNSTITNAEGFIYIAYRYGATYNGVSDIGVSHSADFGSSWTVVDTSVKGASLTNDVSWPSIAATHGGDTVVLAFQYSFSATDNDIYYSYSADNGITWSNGNALATSSDNEMTPALAVDGGGSTSTTVYGYIHVAYWDNYNIEYQNASYSSLTTGSPIQTVNTGSTASAIYSKPTIATYHRSGSNAYYPSAAWTDFRGASHDIYYSTPRVTYSLTFKFMDNVGANNLTSSVSWFIVKSPTGNYLNLTSYRLPQADAGQWVITKIVYQRTNVVPTSNPTYTLASDSTWTINCRIYTIDFTNSFLDSYGNPLSPKLSNFTLIWPYGKLTSPITVGKYYLQNGTWTWNTITWEGSNVAPTSTTTFNAENGNPAVRLRVYKVDFTNKFKDLQGNPVSVDSFKLISPNGTTSKALSVGPYYFQNGTSQITSVIYQGSAVTSINPSTFDPSAGLSAVTVTLPFVLPLPLIGGVGLVALVAVIAVARRRKPKVAVPLPSDPGVRLAKCRNALAKLDNLYRQGKVSERVYRELKSEYEAEAAALEAKFSRERGR